MPTLPCRPELPDPSPAGAGPPGPGSWPGRRRVARRQLPSGEEASRGTEQGRDLHELSYVSHQLGTHVHLPEQRTALAGFMCPALTPAAGWVSPLTGSSASLSTCDRSSKAFPGIDQPAAANRTGPPTQSPIAAKSRRRTLASGSLPEIMNPAGGAPSRRRERRGDANLAHRHTGAGRGVPRPSPGGEPGGTPGRSPGHGRPATGRPPGIPERGRPTSSEAAPLPRAAAAAAHHPAGPRGGSRVACPALHLLGHRHQSEADFLANCHLRSNPRLHCDLCG